MRRITRTDSNHAEIVRALREMGWSVFDTHTRGADYPDLTVGRNGVTILIEVVGTDAAPHTVREHEARREGWKGGQWLIVADVPDLLRQLGVDVQA